MYYPCIGLARTVIIHRIWLYIWWFPCQENRIYTVYIWFRPTLCMHSAPNPQSAMHVRLGREKVLANITASVYKHTARIMHLCICCTHCRSAVNWCLQYITASMYEYSKNRALAVNWCLQILLQACINTRQAPCMCCILYTLMFSIEPKTIAEI